MMLNQTILSLIFTFVFITIFLVDMYVTDHRKGKISVKAALMWSGLWVTIALLFGLLIFLSLPDGKQKAFEFITGYIVEYSLSVDNLFVFIMIFNLMRIKEENQPHILKWGIIGAVILRILFIFAGVQLIKSFYFMIYVFGVVLVYTAYKMLTSKDEEIHPDKNIFVRIASRFLTISRSSETHHFFVKENGKWVATIAFITLLLVESTDIIFAIDSLPAILAITQDSFIAITSNLFAILGLRSLFFALSGLLTFFRFLKYGISVVLLFIGVKMLISGVFHIPVEASLIVILSVLAISVIASLLIKAVPEEVKEREEIIKKTTEQD
jgi:tellurite resistance protein TerC